MSPTKAQVEAMSDELDYINFRDARDAGEPTKSIVAYWGPVRASEMEARYQAELADRRASGAADELQGQLSRAEAVRS